MTLAAVSQTQSKAAPVNRRAKPKPPRIQPQANSWLGLGTTSWQPTIPPQLTKAPIIQPKLKIGDPNDRFEQEADRVADEVMEISDRATEVTTLKGSGHLSPMPHLVAPQIQRLCTKCDEEEMLQTKQAEGKSSDTSSSIESKFGRIQNHGQSLPKTARSFFEPRFGRSFDQVKIHTDHHAVQLARSVDARAFTWGNNIVFGSGEYQPQSNQGKRLLAHELTHVVQQHGSSQQVSFPQLIQRDSPSVPTVPRPDLECSFDIIALSRILAGDRAAALRVINCCVKTAIGRGCTEDLTKAACSLLPNLCPSNTSDNSVSCPPGFQTARSSDFQGKCCREGTVIENEESCCSPIQIVANALFPHCCPPSQMPDGSKKECIDLPKISLPFPRSETTDTPDSGSSQPSPSLSPLTILFFFDSAIRHLRSNDNFDLVLSILQTIPRLKVQITGHTSSEGSDEYNLRLGQARADGIKDELIIRGIDSSRITTLSLGESVPAISEPPVSGRSLSPVVEAARSQNRRAEIIFIDPKGEFAPRIPTVELRQPSLGLPTLDSSLSLGNFSDRPERLQRPRMRFPRFEDPSPASSTSPQRPFHSISSPEPDPAGGGSTAFTETVEHPPQINGEIIEGQVDRREFVPASGDESEVEIHSGRVRVQFNRSDCSLRLPYKFAFQQQQTASAPWSCKKPPDSQTVDLLPSSEFNAIKHRYIAEVNEGLNGWYALRINGCEHSCTEGEIPIRVDAQENSSNPDRTIDVVNRGGRADAGTICVRDIDRRTNIHEGGHQVLGVGDEYREGDQRVRQAVPEWAREERERLTDYSRMSRHHAFGRFSQFHVRHFRFAQAFMEAALMREGLPDCEVQLVELRRPLIPDFRLSVNEGGVFSGGATGFAVGLGFDVGLPLQRQRSWIALVGVHGSWMMGLTESQRDAFLLGARIGIERNWLTGIGSGQVSGFLEGGGLLERRPEDLRTAPYLEAGLAGGFSFLPPGLFHFGVEAAIGRELISTSPETLRWIRLGLVIGGRF